jgi:mono/diheme cytochrome c family protein
MLPIGAASDAVDLHAYWDQRCQGCHGHAGEFARKFLAVEKGRLVGQHHRQDLDRFLHQHYLADRLVEPITAMLMAQVTTPPLFSQRCAGCHGSAADFARTRLALKNGVLVGASSGRPIVQTLATHGNLTAKEVSVVTESLQRVYAESAGPGRR